MTNLAGPYRSGRIVLLAAGRREEGLWLSRQSRSLACCGSCAGRRGLTQEELAEAAGVSVRAVAYLERGTLTVFRRIGAAEAAGLTAELSAVDHEAVDPPGRPWGHRTRTEGVKPE
jgi:hypothetical protein